jgi:hypothetical protein
VGRRAEASAVAEQSLIEEMRAAVRGDRERAQRRQIVPQSTELEPPQATPMPEKARSEPQVAPDDPVAEGMPDDPLLVPPPARRRWLRLRRFRRKLSPSVPDA